MDSMYQQGLKVSISGLFHLLQECIKQENLAAGRKLRTIIDRSGLESNTFLGCHLIRMFAIFRCLLEANQVFNKLLNPNVYTWSAIISAHAKLGQGEQAIQLYYRMQQSSVKPDGHVFVAVLKACTSKTALTHGKLIHSHILKMGLESSRCVGNTLIDMYAKCGSIKDGHITFDSLPMRDVVTWTAMIAGFSQHGHGGEALQLFMEMQEEGLEPNKVTYVSTLKACAAIAATNQGNVVHAHMIERGYELDVYVGSILVDMYAKCGRLEDAYMIFDRLPKQDVVTWNAVIAAAVHHGRAWESVALFEKMQEEGMEPDHVTFVTLVKACSSIAALHQGRQIHCDISRYGLESNVSITNALIDMYIKCGRLQYACHLFEKLPMRDVVTWSAMIAGYAQHKHSQEAIWFFRRMQQEGMEPNQVTFIGILKVCSITVALDQGKLIHGHIIEYGLDADVCVGSSLIQMYAKCGSLRDACRVFDSLPNRDVVTWGTMLAACASHNDYKLALEYFEGMEHRGLKPDKVTFVSLLAACSHVGLLEKGFQHFQSMGEACGIAPTIDHYNCMVDLLGRGGQLREASDLLQILPFGPNIFGWTALLSHSRIHCNVEIGKWCFDHVVAMDCRNAAGYALMSNIYANAGMHSDANRIEDLRKLSNAWNCVY